MKYHPEGTLGAHCCSICITCSNSKGSFMYFGGQKIEHKIHTVKYLFTHCSLTKSTSWLVTVLADHNYVANSYTGQKYVYLSLCRNIKLIICSFHNVRKDFSD